MPGSPPSQPGWYPDGDGGERWYDGNAWTDHTRDAPANEPTVVIPTSAGDPSIAPTQLQVGRGLQITLAIGGVLLLIAIGVVGGLVLLGGEDDKAAGSDETTSPSVSESVATDPSSSLDVPTLDPSDFPTLDPSDFPTVSPEVPDLPTGLPTGFPDLPSEFPTDPSGWETFFSDYLEQVQP